MVSYAHVLRKSGGEAIGMAKATGLKLGLVTGTSRANIDGIFNALRGEVDRITFDLVTDATTVANGKPAPDLYLHALEHFDRAPHEAFAIEDTEISREAAVAAGIPCNDFPGVFALRAGIAMEPVSKERLVLTLPPPRPIWHERGRERQKAPRPYPAPETGNKRSRSALPTQDDTDLRRHS